MPLKLAAESLLPKQILASDGEMSALISFHDWAATPLGPVEQWPDRLIFLVEVMLESKTPMFLLWGSSRTFIYNDAYISVLGQKHPWALGRSMFEIWPEVRGQVEPIIDQAYAGQPSYYGDLPVILRRGEQPEQTYFTFSYSPVRVRSGEVVGALCTLQETTDKVQAENRLEFLLRLTDELRGLQDPLDVFCEAARMLGEHLGVSRVGYGDVDETARYFTTPRNWTDGTVEHHTGTHDLAGFGPEIHAALQRGEPLVVRDVATDPRTVEPGSRAAFAYLEMEAVATVSLIKNGRMVAALYVHSRAPRNWTEAEVRLIQDVAERTWDAVERARAEAALRSRESHLRLAIEAGRMAVWMHDSATDTITTTPELNRLLGYPSDAQLDVVDVRSRYYPGDRELLVKAAMEAIQRGENFFEVEYRFYRVDGDLRWFLMRAEMDLGPGGMPTRSVGVILDITDRKRNEEELQERDEELRAALEAGSLAMLDYDHTTGLFQPSPRLNEFYGYPADHRLTIKDIRARYHPDDLDEIFDRARQDHEDPTTLQFDWTLRLCLPDSTIRWVNGRGEYIRDEAGRILRSRGVVMDITERKRWEEHQRLLLNELNHRVKNTLATVQSIATQTLRNAGSTEEALQTLEERLLALSRAHNVLTEENWEAANLSDIVAHALSAYQQEGRSRLHVSGEDVRLPPGKALSIAMALHELATNAVKYGALSNDTGEISLKWTVAPTPERMRLDMTWVESGGPLVKEPARRGFGTRLIERSLSQDLGGDVHLAFEPTGLVCTIGATVHKP